MYRAVLETLILNQLHWQLASACDIFKPVFLFENSSALFTCLADPNNFNPAPLALLFRCGRILFMPDVQNVTLCGPRCNCVRLVSLEDYGRDYQVALHIQSAGLSYTCNDDDHATKGRSLQVKFESENSTFTLVGKHAPNVGRLSTAFSELTLEITTSGRHGSTSSASKTTSQCSFPTQPLIMTYVRYHTGRCHRKEFRCRNLRCIDIKLVLDGADDCGDGSDEAPLQAQHLFSLLVLFLVVFFVSTACIVLWFCARPAQDGAPGDNEMRYRALIGAFRQNRPYPQANSSPSAVRVPPVAAGGAPVQPPEYSEQPPPPYTRENTNNRHRAETVGLVVAE